jgi:methylated-DNA-protein-cysteine methyltransferase related protein
MNKSSKNVYKLIYNVIAEIPKGKVATYKQVANLAGLAGHARMVGYALNKAPEHLNLPWHRVINSQGKISYAMSRNGHDDLQKHLLIEEGVVFSGNGIVDLEKYGFYPRTK